MDFHLDLSVNSPEIKGKLRTIGPSPINKSNGCTLSEGDLGQN
jgi:hypothetical protein